MLVALICYSTTALSPLPTPVTMLMARVLPEQHRVSLELLSGAMRVMYKTPLVC